MSAYEDILSMPVGSWRTEDVAKISEHLELIEDIDLAEACYSFDLLRIYLRKHDGMLLWATDSGCSCPSPFEDINVGDLSESTSTTLLDTFMGEWSSTPGYSYSEAEVRKEIASAIREAVKRGAR